MIDSLKLCQGKTKSINWLLVVTRIRIDRYYKKEKEEREELCNCTVNRRSFSIIRPILEFPSLKGGT